MSLMQSLTPTGIAERLGAFDVITGAMARTTGALRLMRTAVSQEVAPVAPTPCTIIDRLGAATLMRYETEHPTRHNRPVLLIPSVINRHYILDLMEGNSVVQALNAAGHEVYIVDWGDPGEAELHLDFSDFVLGRLRHFVDRVIEDSGTSDDLHLLGHCLGGTMAASLAAVDNKGIASLILLTAPMGFHDTGILSAWTRAPFFDPRAITGGLGHVPSWLTQPSFMVLRPMGPVSKGLRLFQKLGDERFVTFFRALETWINDNVDIPAGFYIDLIEELYRKDGLLRGTFQMRGHAVVLEEIDIPVLTVCAQNDHIVPPQSAMAGHERFSSKDKHLEVFPGGHIGVVIGGLAKRNLIPMLDRWLSKYAFHEQHQDLGENEVSA